MLFLGFRPLRANLGLVRYRITKSLRKTTHTEIGLNGPLRTDPPNHPASEHFPKPPVPRAQWPAGETHIPDPAITKP